MHNYTSSFKLRTTLQPCVSHGEGRPRLRYIPCHCKSGHGDVVPQNAASLGRRQWLVGAAAAATASQLSPGPQSSALAEAAASPVPNVELASGLEISQIIKGCWQLAGGHRGDRATDRTAGNAAQADLQSFYDAGITTLDTADIYYPSEKIIGQWLARQDRHPRAKVLTKFCVFGSDMYVADDPDVAEQAVKSSCSRLGLPALDLLQKYQKAAANLADLQKRGLVRHLGVTNFDVPRIKQMQQAGATFVSNQVQYSLLDRRPEVAMVPFCQEQGLSILPFGVAAGGFLSDKYLGMPFNKVIIDTYSLSKYASIIGLSGGWDWFQGLLQVLQGIASKHGTSIANIAARWVLDRPAVPALIIGARNANHVDDHLKLFSFALDAEDCSRINDVLAAGRQPTSDCYTWERGGQW